MNFLSRTDLNTAQLPAVIPVMGPMGSIVIDPDFGCKIIRATDSSVPSGGQNWCAAGIGGSADANIWNTDCTLLYIENSGGAGQFLEFNPVTYQIKHIFPGLRLAGGGVFSKVDANTFFNLHGSQFLQYDLSDRSAAAPPAPTVVCDFAPHLPGAPTWQSLGGVENGDTVFTAGFAPVGGQDNPGGLFVCAYVAGKGARLWNTQTGMVSGDWGPIGAISAPNRFNVHNVKAGKGLGQWVIATPSGKTDVLNQGPAYWDMATDQVTMTGSSHGGHFAGDDACFYNNDSSPLISFWAHARRHYTAPGLVTAVAFPSPAGSLMVGLDDHFSMNGPGGLLLSVSTDLRKPAGQPFPAAWYNEVLGFDVSGSGKVSRFCHTFASGKANNFYSDNAIGAGDQQDKFFAFTSDWMGTLGRSADVFIVALK